MGEEAFELPVALLVLKGAAAATMLSMLVYFALFSRDLRHDLHGLNLPKWALVVGGLAPAWFLQSCVIWIGPG